MRNEIVIFIFLLTKNLIKDFLQVLGCKETLILFDLVRISLEKPLLFRDQNHYLLEAVDVNLTAILIKIRPVLLNGYHDSVINFFVDLLIVISIFIIFVLLWRRIIIINNLIFVVMLLIFLRLRVLGGRIHLRLLLLFNALLHR